MQTPKNAPTSAPETVTETADITKVPLFSRKQGRPGLIVRTGVHGGREMEKKGV